ncbi:MAG: acetyltransferase [Clostridia bacterium]|jgi:RimJ/RimL family protein N-acetyltransferase|nr:acetyltransferase [Clostridia bacterium]
MYTGEKVKIRAYQREDVPLAQQYLNDAETKRLLVPGIPYPFTLEEENKWFETISSQSDTYSFAIESIEEGKYIGGCGVNRLEWKNSVATVGIFIGDKNYWGKGYGTDAMKVLLKFIFEQMNINKVKLFVYSFNNRAVKSYEKCGFVREGLLRQEIFRDGKYQDVYIMAILKDEYFQQKCI